MIMMMIMSLAEGGRRKKGVGGVNSFRKFVFGRVLVVKPLSFVIN